ncbi:MAG: dephospho-CoA kinase [Rhodospirillaceae bacterium]|jgi:dephospho-CoA kinase|nr:dephospho-CoA kinase [Rhodospirillaceae bacterium]
MIILGLTGSIGMGKTTAAKNFKSLGVPIHDADAAVHGMLAAGGEAVEPIAKAFPDAVRNSAVDRQRLGALVFDDNEALRRLEKILHPRVYRHKQHFLARAARAGSRVVVLDVPLLYETGGERGCDAVVCVSAPPFVQAARVLARPGMTPEKLKAILARQMPDAEKRRRADFIVPTGLGRVENLRAVRTILDTVRNWRGRHWPPFPVQPRIPRNPSSWAR